jgi:NAD(P)-dependent dehydrogenase (short-subunit alcohol dehydrogenase family)
MVSCGATVGVARPATICKTEFPETLDYLLSVENLQQRPGRRMTAGNKDRKDGKPRVLIIGGTRGIGRGIAEGFASNGCEVIVTGLDPLEVEQARTERPQWNVNQLDLRDKQAIQSLVSQLATLDVLVNAAGVILRAGKEHDPEEFEKVIDVNLNGIMRVSTACRKMLAESKGCVLNLASMLSFFGSGHVPAYSASKGGVAQLTKSLAIAWAKDGIRVNALAPGWIKTQLTEPLYSDPDRSREILARTPLGRWGDPADIAGAAVFLCSPAASFITGAILPVDGGYLIA